MFAVSEAVTEFLARVEPLSAPRRDREVTRYARSHSPFDAAAVVTELEARGGVYPVRLAGLMAVASRNLEWITKAIGSTDPNTFRIAIGCSIRHPHRVPVPDAVFEAALDDAPRARRRLITAAGALSQRPQLADKIFERVRAEWGDRAAAGVLVSCSAELVEQHLAHFVELVDWRFITKRHPLIVINTLVNVLEPSSDTWDEVVKHFPRPLTAELLSRLKELVYSPDDLNYRFLENLIPKKDRPPPESLDPEAWLDHECIGSYCGHITRDILRKLLRSKSPKLDKFLGIKPADEWLFQYYLLMLPMPERKAVCDFAFERGAAFDILKHGQLNNCFLECLPKETAASLIRPHVNGDTAFMEALSRKRFLPPGEVREDFLTGTRRSDGDDRYLAWKYFLANFLLWEENDSDKFTEFLQLFVERTRNDRAEVRAGFITDLSYTRASLWTPKARAILDQLRQDATDYGVETLWWYLTQTVSHLFRSFPTNPTIVNWALGWFQDPSQKDNAPYGGWNIPSMTQSQITLKDAKALYEILKPSLADAISNKDWGFVLSVVSTLGPRGVPLRGLYETVRQVYELADNDFKLPALFCWLAPAKTQGERAGIALEIDPSSALLPTMAGIITLQRTDLIEKVLKGPLIGHFSDRKNIWMVPYAAKKAVQCWTSSQMEQYCDHLERNANDEDMTTKKRAEYIRGFGIVPGGAARAVPWVDSDDVRLSEAGLYALGGSESHLSVLLSYGGDDRARIASPRVYESAQLMRPSEVEPIVATMLTTSGSKVVTRKAALGLVARLLPISRQVECVSSLMSNKHTHRDIRVLCVQTTLQTLLNTLQSMDILRVASIDPEEDVRTAVVSTEVSVELYPAYVKFVSTLLHSPYSDVVKSAAGWFDRGLLNVSSDHMAKFDLPAIRRRLAHLAITNLESTTHDAYVYREELWYIALAGAISLANNDAQALCEAINSLIGDQAASDSGDMLKFRRIEAIVDSLANNARTSRRICRDVADLLLQHPQYASLAGIPLAVSLEPADTDSAAIIAHFQAVGAAFAATPTLIDRISRDARVADLLVALRALPADTALQAAQQLADDPTYSVAVFACALAEDANRGEWPQPWSDVVWKLRKHPSEDVRVRAFSIFMI